MKRKSKKKKKQTNKKHLFSVGPKMEQEPKNTKLVKIRGNL